ncbi:hypothetical protein EDD15DRAFT_2193575 [Pisolithus albus]|nr:hypothetical protein EDD15DRAFT_2193575 [Pisolithus albus]
MLLALESMHLRLGETMPMFKSRQEIFRCPNFVNLGNDSSTYMGFLEHGNLDLLSISDRHDSVEVSLRMVVQAVYSLNTPDVNARRETLHIKKLLRIAVPVSPVPFSRTAPPTNFELSMLLNCFSATACCNPPRHSHDFYVRLRISQARRCVNFKETEADEASRDEALGWLAELANVLMDDYNEAESSQ